MGTQKTALRLEERFAALRAAGRKAFIPFVPAGDPSLAATGDLIRELARCGADVIEVGVPYSDPLADGPVITASYARALRAGFKLEAFFAAAKRWAQEAGAVPLVAMTAYSLVCRQGAAAFVAHAQAAGFAGLIVPDLPAEEAAELAGLAGAAGLALIQLVAPTTPPERAAKIASLSSGFLYVVSVTGITGERATLSAKLHERLAWLRTKTKLPLCVGFGVSRPEQVRELASVADGVIVGSALVKRLEAPQPWPDIVKAVGAHAAELRAAL